MSRKTTRARARMKNAPVAVAPPSRAAPDYADQMLNAVDTDEPRRLLSVLTSAARKQHPLTSGVLDYFPDALAAVSNVSHRGNEKHNPGQSLHWARDKSSDHADCILRHLAERGSVDAEGVPHSYSLAWRALALAQLEAEEREGLDPPRGALPPR
jgi:hypothetical protein